MRKGFIWLIGFLVAALIAFLVLPVVLSFFGGGFDPVAHADSRGDDITQSNDMNNQTAGDIANVTEGSTALGFGRSSFDVDIAQCRESHAFDTILFGKQTVKLNNWCVALWYDSQGLHHMAAVMRCDIEEIAKHFPTTEGCIVANKLGGFVSVPTGEFIDMKEAEEEHEREIAAQAEEVEAVKEQLAAVVDRITTVERSRRAAAREVATEVGITEEQRQAIAEVFADDLGQN